MICSCYQVAGDTPDCHVHGTTTHECPTCGDIHLPPRSDSVSIPDQGSTKATVFPPAQGPRPVSGFFRPCGRCGGAPSRHNAINRLDYVGHEYE